ncbi:hypothetical protein ACFY8W_09450 [Streptomyces sp. NPDC012637]|uniref:hypothetical protein n=1 Tax=Streptomyces sp. NPDC012637 TaxID=3364842 RepID=UPI0036EC9101
MADERYQWLDQEAAERLLRGEPVDPVDDASRAQAELLARVLETARTPAAGPVAGPDGELPGEAAALAAFRKAVAERAAGAAVPGYAGQAATDLGRVRIAPVLTGRRWGRSLRYGLAAAVAAVTVGGVAVAAGTGMLPLTTDPEPGKSVVSVGTTPPGESGSPGTSGSPSGGAGTQVPGVPTDRDGQNATPGATDGPGTSAGAGGTARPGETADGRTPEGDERTKVIQACQDYRAGRLADSGRDRLVNALRSGETVKRYCDRILSGAPATATATPKPTAGRTSSGGPGSGGSGDSDSGSADGDDKSDRGDHDRDHGKNRDRDGGGNGGTGGATNGGTHGKDRSRS